MVYLKERLNVEHLSSLVCLRNGQLASESTSRFSALTHNALDVLIVKLKHNLIASEVAEKITIKLPYAI